LFLKEAFSIWHGLAFLLPPFRILFLKVVYPKFSTLINPFVAGALMGFFLLSQGGLQASF